MTDDARTMALRASIAHWEANARAKTPDEATLDADNCALCGMYNTLAGCTGCQVFESTGRNYCWGTPYFEAKIAYMIWKLTDEDEPGSADAKKSAFHAAARAEVEFLRGLLPSDSEEDSK